jgi:hypothetical protein
MKALNNPVWKNLKTVDTHSGIAGQTSDKICREHNLWYPFVNVPTTILETCQLANSHYSWSERGSLRGYLEDAFEGVGEWRLLVYRARFVLYWDQEGTFPSYPLQRDARNHSGVSESI